MSGLGLVTYWGQCEFRVIIWVRAELGLGKCSTLTTY